MKLHKAILDISHPFGSPEFACAWQGHFAPSSCFSHQGFLASRGGEEIGKDTCGPRFLGHLFE
jgi:hypothetical protein